MNQHLATAQPWYITPPPAQSKKVVVIGGGIAGSACAWSLAKRGLEVILLEQESALGQHTTGHPGAVILPVASFEPNLVSRFHQIAYDTTLAQIEAMIEEGHQFEWKQTGVVHLLVKKRLQRVYDSLPAAHVPDQTIRRIGSEETNRITGLPLNQNALYYPLGGHLNPPEFCRAFVDRADIDVRFYKKVSKLHQEENLWRILDQDQNCIAEAETVVIASGCDSLAFEQTSWLPIRKSRGQLAYIPTGNAINAPRCVLCHEGYLIPNLNGLHLLGATWSKNDFQDELRIEDQQDLIKKIQQWASPFSIDPDLPLRGRVGYRAKTTDHLPLAGPLPDFQGFKSAYGQLHHGGKNAKWPEGPYHPGLYVTSGHGARGMISSYISGELIATQITGEQPPIEKELVDAVNPARFLIRELKRKPDHRKDNWFFEI